MKVTVCRTKKHYDTEWEATQAAHRVEERFKEIVEPYRCDAHWHLTHSNPDQRKGHGHNFTKCDDCGELIKKIKLKTHRCKRVYK